MLLLVLALMGGIGVVIYLKFIKKKPQTTATHDPDDYEYDDGEEIRMRKKSRSRMRNPRNRIPTGAAQRESGDKQA